MPWLTCAAVLKLLALHITRMGHCPLSEVFRNLNVKLVTIGLLAFHNTYITSISIFHFCDLMRIADQVISSITLSSILKLELSSPGEDICSSLVDW